MDPCCESTSVAVAVAAAPPRRHPWGACSAERWPAASVGRTHYFGQGTPASLAGQPSEAIAGGKRR